MHLANRDLNIVVYCQECADGGAYESHWEGIQRIHVSVKRAGAAYHNFYRSRFFPTEAVDAQGRIRKHYRYDQMMTPYGKLRSLPEAAHCLKPGVAFEQLDAIACAISDNEAAHRLKQAQAELFRSINKTQNSAA